VLGTALLDGTGQASFTTTALALGGHSVTASYAGDANFTGITSAAVAPSVSQAATTVALSSSGTPSAVGQPVTFTATVTAQAPGSGTPTGTVVFLDGTTELGRADLDATGVAAFTYGALSAGGHAITASYLGDTNFTAGTSGALTQDVSATLIATTTALTSSAQASVYSQSVTLTAVVTPGSGTGVPVGLVTFLDGAVVLGTATLDATGQATLTTALLAVGNHNLTAMYGGDGTYSANTSPVLAQAVSQAATSTTLTSDTAAAVYGQAITFTARVGAVGPATGVPTGTVTFLDSTTVLAVVALDATGSASFNTTLPLGGHSITVAYGSDGNFLASTSDALSQSVGQAATTAVVQSSASPSAPTQPVTFTATVRAVAPGAGTPTGTVVFLDGTTELGRAALDGNGVATFTYGGLDVGSHDITASYLGDANFSGITSPAVIQVVSASLTATTTVAVSSSPAAVYGQAVTFTATVMPRSGTATPTGTVTFLDGATVLGMGTLDASGRATFTTALLGVGSHSITAVYADNGGFTRSTSPALAQVVNRATTTTTVTSSAVTAVHGQSVTLTATVRADAPGGGVPTGTVTFLDGATVLATVMLDAQGQAAYTTSQLSTGSHSITAVYGGDGNFSGLHAVGLTQVVNRATTSVSLSSDSPAASYGQAVTFTATVSAVAPGAGAPTGTVTFRDGDTVLAVVVVDASGRATFTTSTLAVGSHSITASYDGGPDFSTALSDLLAQLINP
jgi:hypothetical protein